LHRLLAVILAPSALSVVLDFILWLFYLRNTGTHAAHTLLFADMEDFPEPQSLQHTIWSPVSNPPPPGAIWIGRYSSPGIGDVNAYSIRTPVAKANTYTSPSPDVWKAVHSSPGIGSVNVYSSPKPVAKASFSAPPADFGITHSSGTTI
jgi:hypothetical protein